MSTSTTLTSPPKSVCSRSLRKDRLVQHPEEELCHDTGSWADVGGSLAALRQLHARKRGGILDVEHDADADLDSIYWAAACRPFECYLLERKSVNRVISPDMYELLL